MQGRKLILAMVVTVLVAPAMAWAGPKVIKYAHFQPAKLDQPKQAAALAFKNYVEANTQGSLTVEIYPASQLGNAITVLEGLKLGSIEMGVVHDGPISPVFKPFMVYAIPYLFDDQAMAWSVVDGPFGQELAEAMRAATGIRMFALADNGIRHFTNSKRVIQSPADMKGLKIRVMPGPIWSKLVDSLGASPSPVPWPELPAALQQGVVDGQENGVTNILAASLYQNQKYISLDGHVYSWHAYLMNDRFYAGLTPEEQKVIHKGVEIAKVIHRGMTSAQDMNAPTMLSGVGMQVTPLSPDQVAAFRQQAQPAVVSWVKEQIGEEWVQKIFDAIEAYRQSH
ncbi:MAG: DctP family TRAP transporter solute-binding subunit [Desulfobacterales bacterium]|nr:MAG: DctP family TRAP transporter solute-binding subunit [Desulfobacterales bacterium]